MLLSSHHQGEHVVDFPNRRISKCSRLSITASEEQMQVPVLKIQKQKNQPNGVSQMPSKINARGVRPCAFRRAHATTCVESWKKV